MKTGSVWIGAGTVCLLSGIPRKKRLGVMPSTSNGRRQGRCGSTSCDQCDPSEKPIPPAPHCSRSCFCHQHSATVQSKVGNRQGVPDGTDERSHKSLFHYRCCLPPFLPLCPAVCNLWAPYSLPSRLSCREISRFIL